MTEELPILERRRIEAEILKWVHKTIEERSGRAEANAVVGEAVSRAAIAHGKTMSERFGGTPDLDDFLEILPNWTKGGALEIEMLHASPEQLEFDVVRCRYAEMYRQMGLGDIGALLSCNRDGDFCIGFNPDMKLDRPHTIMAGDDHCDFRYRMASGSGDAGAPPSAPVSPVDDESAR
ncbi:2-amino-thiazoline-4-carboxylic acid hydrolase [Paracoccus suum]|uniref:2-amino-thiazoline-4-carboxylic acid hydrolase n=1 Tax=Paracoccus suum TaxID=2259340 RepID=A0A344PMZ1_9RHOB|nr:L-2-amino-thiazoline-4-carboxylic acid hydrolase [Paracoccus suum]AXC50746.1 2-amino-thiazoline-4-carboxylic acid hydrolase [Paracoccus suum]